MKSQNCYHRWPLGLIIFVTSIILAPLQAQNYNEVNVYGWGLALDQGFPTFADIDDDGYVDMLVGTGSGTIWHLEQTTSREFALITRDFNGIDVGSEAMPVLINLDNNGLLDLIIGSNSEIEWYEQQGVGSEVFIFVEDDDIFPPDIPINLIANVVDEVIDLYWTPSSAEDIMLYNIYRSTRHNTTVSEYINSVSADNSTFSDSSITESGRYYYWLTALDSSGNESGFSQSDSADITIISALDDRYDKTINEFTLGQNFPNPFNPTTIITYELQITNFVELSIFNLLGEKVAALVSEKQNAGKHQIEWDASGFATGIYYYMVTTGEFNAVKKMILIL